MVEIPISAIPSQELNVLLGDQQCRISLYQKGLYIFLDLVANDVEICKAAICQDGSQVVQSPSPDFSGTLHFFDWLGTSQPEYSGLGTRWKLYYLAADETPPAALEF